MQQPFKFKLLKEVSEQKNPIIRTDFVSLKLEVTREEIVKTLLELRKEGEIYFVIKPDGDLYLTHIDGNEIQWTLEEENVNKELFDREGNLHIDPYLFFDTISQLPEVSDEDNKKLFLELSELDGEEYDRKILTIATKNIRLIRSEVFEVLENEEFGENDLLFIYKTLISNFCRSIERYDFSTPYSLKTYSAWWIFQAKNRARSKIIQKWLDEEWGFTVGIQKIDTIVQKLKLSLNREPTYFEVFEAVEPMAKKKYEISLEKEELLEEKHFQKIGLNKLFTEVIGAEITVEPSYDDKIRLESAIECLDEREIDVINKRYGLHDEKYEYGLTLEEVAKDYGVTRERIRQIVNESIKKIKFYFKDEDINNDYIPLVFFPKNIQNFLEKNNFKLFSNILEKTKRDLLLLEGGSLNIVNKLEEILNTLGIYLQESKKGEINFEKLSVRSTNALINQNILTNEELLKLSEEELDYIPNLGEKSIKEIVSYQKQLMEGVEKPFTPEKVILFPCANPVSQNNFEKTMKKSHSLESIKKYLLAHQYNELNNIGDEFFFWGTKSGTDKKWQAIPSKSLALFFANKLAFSYGFVEYKLINQPLSEYFWGKAEQQDRYYKYMFACSKVREVSIPQYIVNEKIGYKENFVVQGFMVLDARQSFDLINLINQYKFE